MTMESLDDNLLQIYVAKYVDDLTLVESVHKDIAYVETDSGAKPTHTIHPPNTQIALDTIAERAKNKHMQINTSKTQILTISSSNVNCNSYLLDKTSERILSGSELKRFYFHEKPNVQLQIDNLIRKANKRIYLLLNYKKMVCT